MSNKRRQKKSIARAKAIKIIEGLPVIAGLKPEPYEMRETIQSSLAGSADSYRFFDCVCYDECLRAAAIGDWRGFSCRACPVFEVFADKWSRIMRKVRVDERTISRDQDRGCPLPDYPTTMLHISQESIQRVREKAAAKTIKGWPVGSTSRSADHQDGSEKDLGEA